MVLFYFVCLISVSLILLSVSYAWKKATGKYIPGVEVEKDNRDVGSQLFQDSLGMYDVG